jgi:ABC-type sulfate transport system permease component
MTKGTLFVLGLALIIIGQTVLLNDITTKVYVGDIFSLLGVVLTLLARTNVLITDKVRKVKADKKVEIIEV